MIRPARHEKTLLTLLTLCETILCQSLPAH
jgi:hypothetical protein